MLPEALTAPLNHQSNPAKIRHCAQSTDPTVFTDIYQEGVNIAIWQRQFSDDFSCSVSDFLQSRSRIQEMLPVSPENAMEKIGKLLGDSAPKALVEDISQLVDMFCCLFELETAGLRLATLDQAMCPKFHIDRVPCRLVTTYQGVATEWLPHSAVNRDMLGKASIGVPDDESGLYKTPENIRQLNCGDVALLKGELWQDNEGAGLVHRSPATTPDQQRLLLTLDFID